MFLFLWIFLESKSTLESEMMVLAMRAELLRAGRFLSDILCPESGFILSNRSIIKIQITNSKMRGKELLPTVLFLKYYLEIVSLLIVIVNFYHLICAGLPEWFTRLAEMWEEIL